MSGTPWLPQQAWKDWNEAYRTTYREYVRNQRAKDDALMGVRAALSKVGIFEQLDPGWMQLVKFHQGTFALAEYAAVVAEQRMARFGRDSAWRTMATLGALDETRHGQIPLLMGHDMLPFDGNFDWTHKAYHTNEWIIVAARHLFDDMFLAADAVDLAIQLNFVLETGFTNLQFMAMAAMADGASPPPVREGSGEHPDRRGAPRSDRPPGTCRTLIENGRERTRAIPRRQDVVALLAALPRVDGVVDGLPRAARCPATVVQGVHGRMDHRAVHEEHRGILAGEAMVLGSLHRGARLRAS